MKRPSLLPKRRRAGRARSTALYTAMTVAGALLVDLGVGLVFVPAALVLAGLAVGIVGFFGMGMSETPQ